MYQLLETACDIVLISCIICIRVLSSYINLCVNLLNVFTKDKHKLEMFVTVCWSYVKWCILIVRSTVPLFSQSGVKVWILTLSYKSISSFVDIFLSGLKTVIKKGHIRLLQLIICFPLVFCLAKQYKKVSSLLSIKHYEKNKGYREHLFYLYNDIRELKKKSKQGNPGKLTKHMKNTCR